MSRILDRQLLAFMLLGAIASAHALESDRSQPIHVSADSASADQKTGRAVYRGSVVVLQGTLDVRADEVTLTVGSNGNVQKVIAKGNPARYQQRPEAGKGLVTAEAQTVEYDATADRITLTGNARLKQDSSSFTGASISYSINRQQVEAKGDSNNRVQLVFPPQAKDNLKDKAK